jgi:hypothetical protein
MWIVVVSKSARKGRERERERESTELDKTRSGNPIRFKSKTFYNSRRRRLRRQKKVAKKTIDDVCNARARDKVNDSAAHLSFRGGCGAPHFYLCNARCTNEEHQTPASFF